MPNQTITAGDDNARDTSTSTSETKPVRKSRRSSRVADAGEQVQSNIKETVVESEQGEPKVVIATIEADTSSTEIPTIKKRRKKKIVKPKNENEKVKDIQALLEGVFLIVSLKAGEHWQIEASESKQIALPLSNILERYDLLNKATEISDPLALVIASVTIVLPRVMMSKMSAGERKTKVLTENGVIGNEQKNNSAGSSGAVDKTVNKTKSNDGEYIKSVSQEISDNIY